MKLFLFAQQEHQGQRDGLYNAIEEPKRVGPFVCGSDGVFDVTAKC